MKTISVHTHLCQSLQKLLSVFQSDDKKMQTLKPFSSVQKKKQEQWSATPRACVM